MTDDNNDVWLTVDIKPAFVVTIIEDSTGKSWAGHYTLGRTIKEALTPWLRLPSFTGQNYADKRIRFRRAKNEKEE